MCAFVCECELTRRPAGRWRLRAPLERKKNGEGTGVKADLAWRAAPKAGCPTSVLPCLTSLRPRSLEDATRARSAPGRRPGEAARAPSSRASPWAPKSGVCVCVCHAAHRCPVKRARSREPLQPWTAASSKQLRRCCVLASLTESAGKRSPAVEKRRALLPKS